MDLDISTDNNLDTFCSLPFMAVHTTTGVMRPCCLNQNADWKSYHTVDQYWNSPTIKRLRENLSTGIKDTGCQKCWDMEDRGQMSLRQSVTQHRAIDLFDKNQPTIKQVKLCTGRKCNLSCMMCFDSVSSTYNKTWKSNKTWIMPVDKQIDLTYDQEMDSYIRQHAHELEYIEAIGGEPLFDKRYLDLLEYLVHIGANKNITLFVITNGTIFTPKIKNLFSKFKKTVFAVSIDGVGPVNDYQRWPSKWDSVKTNLSIISDEFDMSILPTITALNIIGLPHLVDFCQSQNYVLNNMGLVEHWKQLLPCNLPDSLKLLVSEQYQSFLTGPADPDSLLNFIGQWDKQRGIRIQDHMPEWNQIYKF
jgi:sulfatase maturation enzyme AslB (radical SAM superfamily)